VGIPYLDPPCSTFVRVHFPFDSPRRNSNIFTSSRQKCHRLYTGEPGPPSPSSATATFVATTLRLLPEARTPPPPRRRALGTSCESRRASRRARRGGTRDGPTTPTPGASPCRGRAGVRRLGTRTGRRRYRRRRRLRRWSCRRRGGFLLGTRSGKACCWDVGSARSPRPRQAPRQQRRLSGGLRRSSAHPCRASPKAPQPGPRRDRDRSAR